LIPHKLNVITVLAFNKSREVLLDDKARRRTSDGDSHADDAVNQLNFADDGSNRIDAPRLSRGFALLEARAWVSNGRIYDPVSVRLRVAVSSSSRGLLCGLGNNISTNLLDKSGRSR
jgi:hypothetical protein